MMKKPKIDEKTRKALKGCKAAGVLLWICFGASIGGCCFLLAAMMNSGNGGALSLLLMTAVFPFLFCWGAKSALRIARWMETNVCNEEGDIESEQDGE